MTMAGVHAAVQQRAMYLGCVNNARHGGLILVNRNPYYKGERV
jgi:hypothetical protein